jgi:hypothetical protein
MMIRRVLELIGVISPLFPFSGYHVARQKWVKWPELRNERFYEKLRLHDEMIRLRVKVVNKLRLNKMDHALVYLETIKEQFTERDL